jgi:transcriptional regulator with XRE-family HTH domain
MTSLNEILAYNMKEYRRKIGLSQAKLAKKAGISLSYLAAVEVCSKFPSPKNLEKLAQALEIDTPELFSMPPTVEGIANKLRRDILANLEQKVSEKVNPAIRAAVNEVVADHLKEMEKQERVKKK